MNEQKTLQDLLSEDIHLLGDILGRVIRRQAGIDLYALEERIRSLAKARRHDDLPTIANHLEKTVNDLTLPQAELIARAFTAYFELVNLAEEHEQVRVLRARLLPAVVLVQFLYIRWTRMTTRLVRRW